MTPRNVTQTHEGRAYSRDWALNRRRVYKPPKIIPITVEIGHLTATVRMEKLASKFEKIKENKNKEISFIEYRSFFTFDRIFFYSFSFFFVARSNY